MALLALVVLLGSASSCSWSQSAPAATSGAGPDVTIIGDSLTVLGRDPIAAALTQAGWRVTIDAYPGRTTGDQLQIIEGVAAQHDRTVVVELGTNDAIHVAEGSLTGTDAAADITRALDQFDGRCVAWIAPDPDPRREGARAGQAIIDQLQSEATHRTGLHVGELGALLAEHPDYLDDDQVHLTDAGSEGLARLMAATVAPCRS